MVDKTALPVLVPSIAGFPLTLLILAYFGLASPFTALVAEGVQWVIFGYAAYWALRIRHVLVLPLYRNHALGIAMVSLVWALTGIIGGLLTIVSAGNGIAGNVAFAVYYANDLVLFYWIDASVRAGRRSDPLARDTLLWSKVKVPLWFVIVGSVVFALAGSIYLYATGNIAALSGLAPVSNNVIVNGLAALVPLLPIAISYLSGLILLPLVAMRSKDKAFRAHMKWFGVFAASLVALMILALVVSLILPADIFNCPIGFIAQNGQCVQATSLSSSIILIEELDVVIAYWFFALGGYALYRSSKSLVPLIEVSPEEGAEFVRPHERANPQARVPP